MLYFRLLQKGVSERETNDHFHTVVRREVRTSSLFIYFAPHGVE